MERLGFVALLVASSLIGCGKRAADPYAPDEMIQSRTRLPSEPHSSVDQPGAIEYDNPQADPPERPAVPAVPREDRTAPRSRSQADDAGAEVASLTTTRPTTSLAADGGYQTVGGVVARVNNTPIYAEQVLAAAEPRLAKLAQDLDESMFRRAAQKEIGDQVIKAIQKELQYAAAERMLAAEDVQRAKDLTSHWRGQQINAAGGSLETARDRAAQQGLDFDELVKRQYREFLWEFYRSKKLFPRIRVTAADMRRFYDQRRGDLFTVNDEAQFELIKIDPKKIGSADDARAKAEELRSRAAAGESFAKLTEFSHGPRMRSSDGSLTWIQRGAFAIDKVEDAVWKLQPGEITPVIEDGGAFYVARLDQKKSGHVMPFDDETVQQRINSELRMQQYLALQEQLTAELRAGSVIRGDPIRDPSMMQPAVEIAMQRYPRWAAK